MRDMRPVYEILSTIKDNRISIYELRKKFVSVKLEIIQKLYLDGSITNIYDKELNVEVVTITNKGRYLLFINEYEKEIVGFIEELNRLGYNTEYVPDYIKMSNFDDELSNILSIDNYDNFVKNINSLKSTKVYQRKYQKNMS